MRTTTATLEPTVKTSSPRRKGRIWRVLRRVVYVVVGLIGILAIYAWVTGAQQAPIETGEPHMKAVVFTDYGPPDVLEIRDIKKPVPTDDQILVKVRAASVNPLDWHFIRGTPYIARIALMGWRKPKSPRLGVDMAGQVEAVGKNVTQFKVGDEVFGGRDGAFAEYVCVRADRAVVLKPDHISFEQAAAVPVAAITALQGLRDKGHIQPGQKVLINGASGGVGTFAVQIAKSFGAEVTGVCSTRNIELVRSLGADHVVDYTKEDFTKGDVRYDVILDNVGNQPLSGFRHTLTPKGICVMIGGGGRSDGGFLGPMTRPLIAFLLSPFVSQKMGFFVAELNKEDLGVLGDLMQAGKVTPVIDKTYPLTQIRDAIAYLETGRARGKVVIALPES